MAIEKIAISNFKSFEHIDIDIRDFNVLIGPNASGKSNFISIFGFLRDIAKDGLEDAISMQGGVDYLRNINIGSSKNFILEVASKENDGWYIRTIGRGNYIAFKNREISWKVGIKFKKRCLGFDISEDVFKLKCDLVQLKRKNQKIEEGEALGEKEIIFSNKEGKINIEFPEADNLPITVEELFSRRDSGWKISEKSLLIESPGLFYPFRAQSIRSISIHDFDPKLSKKATPLTGRAELEEDGSNLAAVIKNIVADKERYKTFCNLIKDLLPFVEKLDIEKSADKSLFLRLQETYFKKRYIPAYAMSDGTINIIALILALFFDRKKTTIIEEPERNIHPHLISKIIEMMQDASLKKQIIVTTHNPEIVKNLKTEDILLISRNKDGFSTVSRPVLKEDVRIFLKNEIGIHDLFVQGLLK